MLIQAWLNGNRELGEHSALPVTLEELAYTTHLVIEVGAQAIHIHPRRVDGAETLNAEDCAAAISTIRTSSPGIPRRYAHFARWKNGAR